MTPDASLLDRLYTGRFGPQEEAELALFFLVHPAVDGEWWMTARRVACSQCFWFLCDRLLTVDRVAVVAAVDRFAVRLGLRGYDWSHVYEEVRAAASAWQLASTLNQLVLNLGLQIACGPLQHLALNGPALNVLLYDELRPLRGVADDDSDHTIEVVRRFTPELCRWAEAEAGRALRSERILLRLATCWPRPSPTA